MTVITDADGKWIVAGPSGNTVAGPFDTNAEAWRAVDRLEGSPNTKAEARADYRWSQQIGGAR